MHLKRQGLSGTIEYNVTAMQPAAQGVWYWLAIWCVIHTTAKFNKVLLLRHLFQLVWSIVCCVSSCFKMVLLFCSGMVRSGFHLYELQAISIDMCGCIAPCISNNIKCLACMYVVKCLYIFSLKTYQIYSCKTRWRNVVINWSWWQLFHKPLAWRLHLNGVRGKSAFSIGNYGQVPMFTGLEGNYPASKSMK